MDRDTQEYLTTMLSTFSDTVEEARASGRCVECRRCADRGCPSTRDWTDGNWTDYGLTAFCPSCITTEEERVARALDVHDRDNSERNWADISSFPRAWETL